MRTSSCTGSAQETEPSTAASWTEPNWRSWMVLKANFPKLPLWLLWVRSERKSSNSGHVTAGFPQGQHLKVLKQRWRILNKSVPLATGDKLWWADQGSDQIGTCDKKDGGNWKVMRNNTSPMMHMRIYDESTQKCKTAYCGGAEQEPSSGTGH